MIQILTKNINSRRKHEHVQVVTFLHCCSGTA